MQKDPFILSRLRRLNTACLSRSLEKIILKDSLGIVGVRLSRDVNRSDWGGGRNLLVKNRFSKQRLMLIVHSYLEEKRSYHPDRGQPNYVLDKQNQEAESSTFEKPTYG
ncbi:hypothetical protein QN277_024522 [Acacia crassicarpa]|uniref:Uncharacterized protein n=1 Tax=Acacia crassicarpa TaxID=499986 RepID=A0AAE1MHE9_9FABA|nr:hypothetical protein QN277_024522 [Acacia crassicarpa]